VSNAGGTQVRWRSDATELFYISLEGRMVAVPIRLDSADHKPVAGTPQALFTAHIGMQPTRQQYLVDRSGERFLMNSLVDPEAGYPITVILNWSQATP